MRVTYDVVIAGAGPAGAFAAALLAARGRSVLLVSVADFASAEQAGGWINERVEQYLEAIGASTHHVFAGGIESVIFYSADFSKTIEARFDTAVGQTIHRKAFSRSLIAAAVAAGATHRRVPCVSSVRSFEDSVELQTGDGACVSGRVLIAADGSHEVAAQLGVKMPEDQAVLWQAHCELQRQPGNRRRRGGGGEELRHLAVVLGVAAGQGFGYVLPGYNSLGVGLCRPGDENGLADAYTSFCRDASAAGLMPNCVSPYGAKVAWHPASAGGALGMEAHVAKRALVIGDAGGFVAAVSNEAVCAGMWSAEVAAEVVDAALDAPNVQDGLADFDTRWRITMAEYLRMPNTDVQLLWPLVFSNQQMADRMAAAFLLGDNI